MARHYKRKTMTVPFLRKAETPDWKWMIEYVLSKGVTKVTITARTGMSKELIYNILDVGGKVLYDQGQMLIKLYEYVKEVAEAQIEMEV